MVSNAAMAYKMGASVIQFLWVGGHGFMCNSKQYVVDPDGVPIPVEYYIDKLGYYPNVYTIAIFQCCAENLPNEIPNSIRWINSYNPLCYLISSTRNVILDLQSNYIINNLNHPISFLIIFVCLLSFVFYKRTAKYIPEII